MTKDKRKEILDFLIKNNGLPEGYSWNKLAKEFGIEAPDKEKAKVNKKYAVRAPGRVLNDIWRKYKKKKMKVVKETYVDGKLKYQTLKKQQKTVPDVDLKDFEIEKITTNPNGNPWIKLKKRDILYDDHLEKLKNIIKENVKPLSTEKPQTFSQDKGLFIYGSDKHIGALTKDNSIYKNKYDEKEIIKRLVTNTIDIIEQQIYEKGYFDSLFIFDLGDALDGFNAKTTNGLRGTSSHVLPQQMDNREQFDTYFKVHKMLFDIIAKKGYAKNIYFVATSNSNHSGSFDYTAMRAVEIYLNQKYPEINTFITDKFIDHFIWGNNAIIFSHGKDDEDMKNGLPLVLNPKVENYIKSYIELNSLNKLNVSFISGDLHQAAETYSKTFRYKKVLSQYGSSKWVHTNFGNSPAGLSIDIIDKYEPIIEKIDIFFKNDYVTNTGIVF